MKEVNGVIIKLDNGNTLEIDANIQTESEITAISKCIEHNKDCAVEISRYNRDQCFDHKLGERAIETLQNINPSYKNRLYDEFDIWRGHNLIMSLPYSMEEIEHNRQERGLEDYPYTESDLDILHGKVVIADFSVEPNIDTNIEVYDSLDDIPGKREISLRDIMEGKHKILDSSEIKELYTECLYDADTIINNIIGFESERSKGLKVTTITIIISLPTMNYSDYRDMLYFKLSDNKTMNIEDFMQFVKLTIQPSKDYDTDYFEVESYYELNNGDLIIIEHDDFYTSISITLKVKTEGTII